MSSDATLPGFGELPAENLPETRAAFGPAVARMGSRRLSPSMAVGMLFRCRSYETHTGLTNNSMDHGVNLFRDWTSAVDCGDIINRPFGKHELQQG